MNQLKQMRQKTVIVVETAIFEAQVRKSGKRRIVCS
ncbi:hypothetical protein Bresa_02327|uniref:Uncharacterized protein n=1 Tax=Brenneria salicis ATCC 15712 = DSM 30166 TaxID=714314 RepID=A0A366I2L4_9GAMM|nr:hypothetical protein [Brenneria salicis ATCC 15712 = DSM 30166]RBP61180.1 hypothetical protein DES54_12637 [Brenneria salicis ATCC 15712 = DSM 30166]